MPFPQRDPHPLPKKVVVAFDICSSTAILEDLIKTENHTRWATLLTRLDQCLVGLATDEPFDIYKFLGDGYILLFDFDHDLGSIFRVLQDIGEFFDDYYSDRIRPRLERPPAVTGITAGIDRGTLVKVAMREQREFVGRPINIACRLQSALKDNDESPAGKALISAHYYAAAKRIVTGWKVMKVTRNLRNIGEKISCSKVYFANGLQRAAHL